MKGYLAVSISNPTYTNTGEYACWVRALNHRGIEVRYETRVDVKVVRPEKKEGGGKGSKLSVGDLNKKYLMDKYNVTFH